MESSDDRSSRLRGRRGGTLSRRHLVIATSAAVLPASFSRALAAQTPTPDDAGDHAGADIMSQSSGTHHVMPHDGSTAIWFLGTLAFIKSDGDQTGGIFGTVEFLHPAGFATPLHVHHNEDEAFYVLDGAIQGVCDGTEWTAVRGDFVWLPRESQHGYMVVGDDSVRTLAFSIPAGFEQFVIEAGEPALQRELPPPAEPDFAKLGAAAEKYGQEILGPLPLGENATPAS